MIDPMQEMVDSLVMPNPDINTPQGLEDLLNAGYSLPPGLVKAIKKKMHKQRMEDFRNGKLKGKQNA